MKTQDVYLISPSTVKAMTSANLNVSDDILSYAIRNAQDMHLRFIVGDDILASLKKQAEQKINKVKDSIDEPYNTLLYDYVLPFLAAQSVVEACIPMTFKIRNIGVVKNNDTNAETLQLSDVLRIKNYYEGIACDAANRLSKYLNDNSKDFVELKGKCQCKINKHYAAVGLWLG